MRTRELVLEGPLEQLQHPALFKDLIDQLYSHNFAGPEKVLEPTSSEPCVLNRRSSYVAQQVLPQYFMRIHELPKDDFASSRGHREDSPLVPQTRFVSARRWSNSGEVYLYRADSAILGRYVPAGS